MLAAVASDTPAAGWASGQGAQPFATLCYQSRSSRESTAKEFDELLADARDRNRRFGVTGMLVHEGDRFFQWLEGPSAALEVLWSSISHDDRHKDVELLAEGVTPARLFSEWDLRFLERGARNGASAAAAEVQEVAPPALERDAVLLAAWR